MPQFEPRQRSQTTAVPLGEMLGLPSARGELLRFTSVAALNGSATMISPFTSTAYSAKATVFPPTTAPNRGSNGMDLGIRHFF